MMFPKQANKKNKKEIPSQDFRSKFNKICGILEPRYSRAHNQPKVCARGLNSKSSSPFGGSSGLLLEPPKYQPPKPAIMTRETMIKLYVKSEPVSEEADEHEEDEYELSLSCSLLILWVSPFTAGVDPLMSVYAVGFSMLASMITSDAESGSNSSW